MKLKILSTFILLLCVFYVSAQGIAPNVLNMGGGYLNAGYYQYEYSVGEMAAIETMSSPSNIITNGVLQPLTDKPFGNNTSTSWSNDEIKIFPVPTRGKVEVDILSKQKGKINMQLVDGAGRVVKSASFNYVGLGSITTWDLSYLASADYFLRITLDPQPGSVKKSGGYKILKVN
jgi:hypothetical protein